MVTTFEIHRIARPTAGISGRIIIIEKFHGENKCVYVWRQSKDPRPTEPFTVSIQFAQSGLLSGDYTAETRLSTPLLENLHHARYVALWKQTGDAFRAHATGPSLAWPSLMGVFLCAPLFLPGVYFAASIYVVAAVLSVYIAAVMDNSPYIMTAARTATSVSVGAALLSLLAWQNAQGMGDKIAAAFRVAVVIPVAFGVISTTQWVRSQATPARSTGSG